MDTFSKLKYLLLFLCLFPSIAFSQAAPTGYVDLAGWVKGADGTYSKAYEGGSRIAPNTGSLKVTGNALVHTSKGAFTIPVEKTANVDLSRMGANIAKVAKAVGPLGLALTAADLVCSLSQICNQAGQWMMNAPYDPALYPDQTTSIQSFCTAGFCSGSNDTRAATAAQSCKLAASTYQFWGPNRKGSAISDTQCEVRDSTTNSVLLVSSITKSPGCPPLYIPSGTVCQFTGNNDSTPASDTDWTSKASMLNDLRFVPELLDKLADIPTGLPTITNNPKQVISQDTTVTRDQNGNATGTKVTTTEAELVDAATAENPGQSIVKEKTTVTNYDINNTVINSSTTTSYTNQPPPPPPEKPAEPITIKPAEPITISFDDVPDDTIQQENVDMQLPASQSWGEGFCPPDETISYHYGTLNFDFQPTCDFATDARPVLITIASILALFIIAGVKTE